MVAGVPHLPFPVLDALPMGAHRLIALTDEALFGACGVRIMFTGRSGGESAGPFASLNLRSGIGDDVTAVEGNRLRVLEAAGASEAALIVPEQVHGTDLVCVRSRAEVKVARDQAARGADGVVVGVSNVAALLCFADCLPLVIVSRTGAFAVVHAGWRGTVAGIAGKAMRALCDEQGCDPSECNAYIGAHIHSECFEVGVEVACQFADAFGADVLADERHVSLARAVTNDLVSAGADPARIADAGICTKCNSDSYYSYRATEGTCGRHGAFAVRLPEAPAGDGASVVDGI